MQTQERKQVIDAINQLGRRVTAADVSAKTGLPLNVANLELNKVAADAEGHMEVSTTGDIAYTFDPGFENAYLASGITRFIEEYGKKFFDIAYFLLRISFGVMLILSFIAVIVLIIAAILVISRMGGDSDSGGGDGGGFSFDFFDWMILRDILWWGSWSSYPDQYQSYDRPSVRQAPQDKGNFFYNVFSFLFGDGNPNNHLEERKWQMIAEVIRNNRGVVTAEQLAPYTGEDPKNDDGVLPVLVRFDGKPEVSETGNILYVFPSMQVHATNLSTFRSGFVPHFLNEFPWRFTTVSQDSLIPVYLLAGVTFLGSWWLLLYVTKFVVLIHWFAPLVTALTIYGTAFLAVPLIRSIILHFINKGIDSRNAKRSEYAAAVQNKSEELLKKLNEAAQYRIGERTINAANTVYTTDKDALEQEFEHEFEPPKHNPYVSQEHLMRSQQHKLQAGQAHNPAAAQNFAPHAHQGTASGATSDQDQGSHTLHLPPKEPDVIHLSREQELKRKKLETE
jgi:hypothetical protein